MNTYTQTDLHDMPFYGEDRGKKKFIIHNRKPKSRPAGGVMKAKALLKRLEWQVQGTTAAYGHKGPKPPLNSGTCHQKESNG